MRYGGDGTDLISCDVLYLGAHCPVNSNGMPAVLSQKSFLESPGLCGGNNRIDLINIKRARRFISRYRDTQIFAYSCQKGFKLIKIFPMTICITGNLKNFNTKSKFFGQHSLKLI